jgi:AraC-like DNA-binding protein
MAAAISAADRSLDLVISLSKVADPLLGLSDNQTCIRAPLFRNASAYFRMRTHGHASTRLLADRFRRTVDSTFSVRVRQLTLCAGKRLTHRSKQHLYSITSSARLSNVAGISMPGVLSGVNNRVLNYREFSFGPNLAFRFNFQRVVQRGQASYVVAVMAPSDFVQL